MPKFEGSTVDHLKLYTLDLKGVIKKDNTTKLLLIEWFDTVETELNQRDND